MYNETGNTECTHSCFFCAGLSEIPVFGAVSGPTFTCIKVKKNKEYLYGKANASFI